jgi:serine/threonine protein kinase
MQLLECVSYFETKVPSAYCVHTPLAMRSLEDTIRSYRADPAAQITLLGDFLNGLSYLHEQKHVMHLDIKPGNLGVLSFAKPKGVILDFDSATSELTSEDHHQRS